MFVDELVLLNEINGSSGFESLLKIIVCLCLPQIWAWNIEFENAVKVGLDIRVIIFNFWEFFITEILSRYKICDSCRYCST